jgi:arsenate reductase-like glutaredoxin family protein
VATVRIQHIRQANLCARGARAWFARHGLDYGEFLKNGIDSEKILALGDHFGNTVVAKAMEEEAKQELSEVGNG